MERWACLEVDGAARLGLNVELVEDHEHASHQTAGVGYVYDDIARVMQ